MATKAATEIRHTRLATKSLRVVATNAVYGKLCRRSLQRLPAKVRGRIDLQSFSSLAEVSLPRKRVARTLVVSRLPDLPLEGAKGALETVGEWKHLLFVEGLPVEAMPVRLLQLDIRNPHRLHVAAERSANLIVDLIYRLFSGIAEADGPQPIVDAWVENENLVLLSPAFDRLSVPLKQLEKFIGAKADKFGAFEIDEDGRFLYWPHADGHLGWEQILQIVDPTSVVAAQQKTKAFNVRYGAAIRGLRERQGLTQSDIDGVTERHLRRVEHGEQAASRGTLAALAQAHALSLEEYLKRLAEQLSRLQGESTTKRSAR